MARIISHEINNPLAIISMAAEVLYQDLCQNLEGLDDLEKADKAISRVRAQLDRIKKIMTTLNKLGIGEYDFERQKINVKDFLEETRDYVSGEICNADLNIEINCVEDIVIHSYKTLLQQSVLNILRNGVEALRGTQQPKIKIIAEVIQSNFIICIANNGPALKGFGTYDVFLPGTSTKGEKRGYGLAATKEFINFCHGQVELREANSWLAFKIIIPLTALKDNI